MELRFFFSNLDRRADIVRRMVELVTERQFDSLTPENRTDIYIVCSDDFGIKFRGGGGLEVKHRLERRKKGAEKWKKISLGAEVDPGTICDSMKRLFGGSISSEDLAILQMLKRVRVKKTRWQFLYHSAVTEITDIVVNDSQSFISLAVEGVRKKELYRIGELLLDSVKDILKTASGGWISSGAANANRLSQLAVGYARFVALLGREEPFNLIREDPVKPEGASTAHQPSTLSSPSPFIASSGMAPIALGYHPLPSHLAASISGVETQIKTESTALLPDSASVATSTYFLTPTPTHGFIGSVMSPSLDSPAPFAHPQNVAATPTPTPTPNPYLFNDVSPTIASPCVITPSTPVDSSPK